MPTPPLTERAKYNAAWHLLQAALNILPSSGSVSTGPVLHHIEQAQEEILERREKLPDE